MSQLKVPTNSTPNTITYSDLKGVDFLHDPSEVDRYRSPDALNMISDNGGNPRKRKGWRKISTIASGTEILDIKPYGNFIYTAKYISTTNKIEISRLHKTEMQFDTYTLFTPLNANYKTTRFIIYNNRIYAFINNKLYDFVGYPAVEVDLYIPFVISGLSADCIGGTTQESVNLLTPFRTQGYTLGEIEPSTSTVINLYNAEGSKYRVKASEVTVEAIVNGAWVTLTQGTDYTLTNDTTNTYSYAYAKDMLTSYTTLATPVVTINTTQTIGTLSEGADNVKITFAPINITNTTRETNVFRYTATSTATLVRINRVYDGTGRTVVDGQIVEGNILYCDIEFLDDIDEFIVVISGAYPYIMYPARGQISTIWINNPNEYSSIVCTLSNSGISLQGDNTTGTKVCPIGTYNEYTYELQTSDVCATYGYLSPNRLFVVGTGHANRVMYSDISDMTYFPDLNYITIGNEGNKVCGFERKADYLLAIKGENLSEPSVYAIGGALATLNGIEDEYFTVRALSTNAGAVNTRCISHLNDEPLFLTSTGVMGIQIISTTSEFVTKNRSALIDRKLLKEDLKNASMCSFNRYCLIATDDHIYVLDGRQTTTVGANGNTDYVYEAYYWEGITINKFFPTDGLLYFTTDDAVGVFNTDRDGDNAYNDNGEAIIARWSTPLDADYRPQYYKNLQKKGNLVMLQQYRNTSCIVKLNKNGADEVELEPYYADISQWENINTDTFSFDISDIAQDSFIRKKIKKYKRLQIVVENNMKDEPFGIIGIAKSYTLKSIAKK